MSKRTDRPTDDYAPTPSSPKRRLPPTTHVSDSRLSEVTRLSTPDEVIGSVPRELHRFVIESREEVRRILSGDDPRIIVVIGPCSIHDPEAAIEYARWFKKMEEMHRTHLLTR